jgi:hypothetical protein
MGDKGAGGKANAVVGIECRSAAHPPRPAQHGDEAVVGMEVRPAEMVALEPFDAHDVKPRLRRVAHEHRVLHAGGAGRIPFDLVGQFVGDSRRIELGRSAGHRQGQRRCRSGEQQAAQAHVSSHPFLPIGSLLEVESIVPVGAAGKGRDPSRSARARRGLLATLDRSDGRRISVTKRACAFCHRASWLAINNSKMASAASRTKCPPGCSSCRRSPVVAPGAITGPEDGWIRTESRHPPRRALTSWVARGRSGWFRRS